MADGVFFTVEGIMLERFINKALESGIAIQTVHRVSDRLAEISVSPAGAKPLIELAEKYKLRYAKTGERGVSGVVRALKSRITALIAIAVFVFACQWYLSRVWIVDISVISGDADLPNVSEVLTDMGARFGAKRGSIDTGKIAARVNSLENVSHASVSLNGVTLTVDIALEKRAPETYAIEGGRDIIACRDGIVVSVDVKSGTALVKAGDTVRRGQILIKGEERKTKEELSDINALGSVMAKVWCEGRAEESVAYEEKAFTGRFSRASSVNILDMSIDILSPDNYEYCQSSRENLPVIGLFIPVSVSREVIREYEPVMKRKDENELAKKLSDMSLELARSDIAAKGLEGAEIVDKWTNFAMIDTDTLRATTVVEILCDIAATRDTLEVK